ncbi:MarR family winged helix-turn-helix transcriptional regulator [Allopusillimonas ginsengisoli]|uniref:MarR family winged helix-turn-helix transcriptional regulator n=1 Tax=Allopusillimonas ginsengisoli TaxID=453575 RepID=UPI001020D332|nr:MarR family transcriptional regulator [Allopusillimonas ginsengisoli]TEA78962.1 MarR family transcriptional regulator [Allopusillimonas ginsengisoli]
MKQKPEAGRQTAADGRQADAVSAILEQWRRERPDLDVFAMGVIGRIKRLSVMVQGRLDTVFAQYGLIRGEFDVLATLRRSGEPFCLAPTALFAALMVTSGTMTHRLQRLEARGLIERLPSADDARSLLVRLTASGRELIDRAVETHVQNEQRILAVCDREDLELLDQQLSRLLAALEVRQG